MGHCSFTLVLSLTSFKKIVPWGANTLFKSPSMPNNTFTHPCFCATCYSTFPHRSHVPHHSRVQYLDSKTLIPLEIIRKFISNS
jgi:hypothetical protein